MEGDPRKPRRWILKARSIAWFMDCPSKPQLSRPDVVGPFPAPSSRGVGLDGGARPLCLYPNTNIHNR